MNAYEVDKDMKDRNANINRIKTTSTQILFLMKKTLKEGQRRPVQKSNKILWLRSQGKVIEYWTKPSTLTTQHENLRKSIDEKVC